MGREAGACSAQARPSTTYVSAKDHHAGPVVVLGLERKHDDRACPGVHVLGRAGGLQGRAHVAIAVAQASALVLAVRAGWGVEGGVARDGGRGGGAARSAKPRHEVRHWRGGCSLDVTHAARCANAHFSLPCALPPSANSRYGAVSQKGAMGVTRKAVFAQCIVCRTERPHSAVHAEQRDRASHATSKGACMRGRIALPGRWRWCGALWAAPW